MSDEELLERVQELKIMSRARPVSYTHLDVYKRQDQLVGRQRGNNYMKMLYNKRKPLFNRCLLYTSCRARPPRRAKARSPARSAYTTARNGRSRL